MVLALSDPRTEAVFAQLDAVLDAVAGLELVPGDVTGALDLTRRVERAGRRLDATQVRVVVAIADGEHHKPDGHATPTVMVAQSANLSDPEAKRRGRVSRALAELPLVAAGFSAGRFGMCQVNRIALAYANPRVREELVALDAQLAILAARLSYDELDERLSNWVRQVDEEGTADRSRRCHENRRARLTQEYDGGWSLLGGFGNLSGAQMHAIHQAFIRAEFAADWAEAREVYGHATTVEHLARSFDQRDADAMSRLFNLAADAFAAAPGGAPIDLTIVMDNDTFERELRRIAGADLDPLPDPGLGPMPADADADDDELDLFDNVDAEAAPQPADDDTAAESEADASPGPRFRCETVDGHPIDPTEAFAAALVGRVRRAVVGWDGVVLEMSGLHKLFTGPLRHAVMLLMTTCYWPGCRVTVSHCQIDHLEPRRTGGRTNPGNGAPACGRHNRLKEHGFTVRRDERGRLHVYRPDGTRIDDWY